MINGSKSNQFRIPPKSGGPLIRRGKANQIFNPGILHGPAWRPTSHNPGNSGISSRTKANPLQLCFQKDHSAPQKSREALFLENRID